MCGARESFRDAKGVLTYQPGGSADFGEILALASHTNLVGRRILTKFWRVGCSRFFCFPNWTLPLDDPLSLRQGWRIIRVVSSLGVGITFCVLAVWVCRENGRCVDKHYNDFRFYRW